MPHFPIASQLHPLAAGAEEGVSRAIAEFALSSTPKRNVKFSSRVMIPTTDDGDTVAGVTHQVSPVISCAQSWTAGIFVGYSGGDYTETLRIGTACSQVVTFWKAFDALVSDGCSASDGSASADGRRSAPVTREVARIGKLDTAPETNLHRRKTRVFGVNSRRSMRKKLGCAVQSGARANMSK